MGLCGEGKEEQERIEGLSPMGDGNRGKGQGKWQLQQNLPPYESSFSSGRRRGFEASP